MRKLIALTLLFSLISGVAMATPRDRLFNSTNRIRQNNNVSPLELDYRLSRYALAHSREMAAQGNIFHTSNLDTILNNWASGTWTIGGENIGTGPSIPSIQRAFMHSASHRTNILLSNYTHVGIGVYQDTNSVYWITVIFWG